MDEYKRAAPRGGRYLAAALCTARAPPIEPARGVDCAVCAAVIDALCDAVARRAAGDVARCLSAVDACARECDALRLLRALAGVLAGGDWLGAGAVAAGARCVFRCVGADAAALRCVADAGLIDRLLAMCGARQPLLFAECAEGFCALAAHAECRGALAECLAQREGSVELLMRESLSLENSESLPQSVRLFAALAAGDADAFPTALFLGYFMEVLSSTGENSVYVDAIVGLFRLTEREPEMWHREFETSNLYPFIVHWIDYPYYRVAEAVMLLINSVYCQQQSIPCLDPTALLRMLAYENEDVDVQMNVRVYAADAIWSYIHFFKNNIAKVVEPVGCNGVLDIAIRIYEDSKFGLKAELMGLLGVIAVNGVMKYKLMMIEMGYLRMFFDVLDCGEQAIVIQAICAIRELFRAGAWYPANTQICYEMAEQCENLQTLFKLPLDEDEEISECASGFLNEFYE